MPIRWSAVKVSEKVANFNDYMKGFSERIRDCIPQDSLEEELKALEYGSKQSLI